MLPAVGRDNFAERASVDASCPAGQPRRRRAPALPLLPAARLLLGLRSPSETAAPSRPGLAYLRRWRPA